MFFKDIFFSSYSDLETGRFFLLANYWFYEYCVKTANFCCSFYIFFCAGDYYVCIQTINKVIMNTKIIVERRVYSNLVKLSIETRKLLIALTDRPEFNKEWLTVSDIQMEFGLSRKIVDGFRKKGLKSNQKKANGKILICRSDLVKFITKK